MFCQWGTTSAIVSGLITMSPGFEPDVFTVSVPGDNAVEVGATLTISDGNDATEGTVLTLTDCRIVDGSWSADPVSRSASFQAMDYRWRWRWATPLNGEYNRRDEKGNLVGTQKTAHELLVLATTPLAAPNGALIANTLAARLQTVYPYVNWENAAPAEEADILLQRYGGMLCPTPSTGQYAGKLYMWEANQGRARPVVDAIRIEEAQTAITVPRTIRLQGARNLYQVSATLTAVGYDPADTTWKTLAATDDDAISYKPDPTVINGWHFGFEEGIADKANKKAAKDSIFRAYRLPDTLTIGAEVLDRDEAMRRWAKNLAETELVEGEERYQKPYITGAHQLAGAEGDPASIITDDTTRVPVEFKIDTRRGIVIFKEPVFTIDGASRAIGATLTLQCAFEGVRFVYDHNVPTGVAATFDVIKSESIYTRYIDDVPVDLPASTALAEAECDARESIYKQPAINASTYTYPGIQDLAPDGLLQQVTWAMDPSAGPITTASWKREHITTMPPLEARQRDLELARYVKERRNRQRNDDV